MNPYPYRRVVQYPHHLGARPSVIAVCRYAIQSTTTGDDSVVVEPQSFTEYIDLSCWCGSKFVEVIQGLWCFHGMQLGSQLSIRGDAVRALLDSPAPLPGIDKQVYSTAHCALMLTVYYRYLPSFKLPKGNAKNAPEKKKVMEEEGLDLIE